MAKAEALWVITSVVLFVGIGSRAAVWLYQRGEVVASRIVNFAALAVLSALLHLLGVGWLWPQGPSDKSTGAIEGALLCTAGTLVATLATWLWYAGFGVLRDRGPGDIYRAWAIVLGPCLLAFLIYGVCRGGLWRVSAEQSWSIGVFGAALVQHTFRLLKGDGGRPSERPLAR